MKSPLIALGLILLLSLFFIPVSLVAATTDEEVKWSVVNIPTQGMVGNWVLAQGSDAQHLTMAIDGTLYAYGKGLTYTLFKSTDGGYNWSYIGKVKDSIVDIATAPNDASIIYYATSSSIYRSTDAGNNFVLLPPNPGGAGSNNVEITSIDVTYLGYYLIVVGTRDIDNAQYGGVYILDERTPFTWTNTNLGNYDVYAVDFSPNYPGDRQLVAVVTNETNTWVTTKVADAAWGASGTAKLDRDNSGIPTPVAVTTSADIAFPADYDVTIGNYVLFVAIDTGSGNGDIYRINGAVATDLNIGTTYGLNNIDTTTVAIIGGAATATLMAGAASSAQVYFSADSGRNWARSTKELTGQTKTYVVIAPDFSNSGKAYAATSGTESAFSYTADGGITWNQLGLINTKITDILDLAPSPNHSQDNTLFMLTYGGKHSLWRSLNDGARWERVYSSALANVDSLKWVELPPQYGKEGSQVVFIAGKSGGNPAIWKSTDNGQNFSPPKFARDPKTGATFSIDIWAVVNDSTLFVGSYDGSNGLVYHTTNSGWLYSDGVIAGTQSLYSIALSPNYDQDKNIMVGNTNGWVYWSNDNGASFKPLPIAATSPPFTGKISVAFDHQFNSNNTVYAASDTADKGIYRFIINKSTEWERIDGTLPSGGMIGQLGLSANGTLYATNFKADGGMERCLNPTYPLGPTFETVTRSLTTGATLTGLWLYDYTLWSIDTANVRLMTYNDTLTLPVNLISPPDKALGIGNIINYTISNVKLDWEALKGATSYKWQLDYDTDFSTIPTGFEGTTEVTLARLPSLEPSTTYYWRVRATEPILSPWSAKWSFTTSLGSDTIAPKLASPGASANGVGLKPIFQWSAIAGADSYELLVSTDVSFANPVVVKVGDYALPSTAWQCDINLNYNTTYYWKVRATGSGTSSAWSAVSAFTSESPPAKSEPSPATGSSSSAPASSSPAPGSPPLLAFQLNAPDWLLKWLIYLGGALFLTAVASLLTLIILTVKIWRL